MGKIQALTPRGAWSIELFDLQRELLIAQRSGVWISLKPQASILLSEDCVEALKQHPELYSWL
jgi:hypothetical protein